MAIFEVVTAMCFMKIGSSGPLRRIEWCLVGLFDPKGESTTLSLSFTEENAVGCTPLEESHTRDDGGEEHIDRVKNISLYNFLAFFLLVAHC
jgi:hypothetical protein